MGGSYRGFNGVRIDFAYTHFFIDDASIGLSSTLPGNTFRGSLNGDFSLTSNLFSVQAVFTF